MSARPGVHRRAVACAALAAALLAVPASAAGPGEGGRRIRLDQAPAGPYRLRALTSPNPPTVENLYIEVRVVEAASGRVLADPRVHILVEPVDADGMAFEVEATHDIAPVPSEYAAHLPVPSTGVWRITVRVDGPLGAGEAGFLERVTRPTRLGAWVAIGAPVAGLLALAGVFFWLQRQARRGRVAPPADCSRAARASPADSRAALPGGLWFRSVGTALSSRPFRQKSTEASSSRYWRVSGSSSPSRLNRASRTSFTSPPR
jgi:hypothetical protein